MRTYSPLVPHGSAAHDAVCLHVRFTSAAQLSGQTLKAALNLANLTAVKSQAASFVGASVARLREDTIDQKIVRVEQST
jgi:hypothetical protein